jgi:p-cumate 2,3-dioxygenase subunit beta
LVTDTLEKPGTRQQVEDFMYMEAHLLDEWRLAEWFELMTEDARYEVPATDVRGGHLDTLSIISDDAARLRQRVEQLLGNAMWCENPRSRTHRLIGNVRIRSEENGKLDVIANFVIHRFGNGRSDAFVGKYEYELVRTGDSFRIRRRTVLLDHESLVEHAKISIIL